MSGIEKIYGNKKLIAVVYRNNIPAKGVKFLTSENNSFQVGIHGREKGEKLAPHVHKLDSPLIISTIQEILYVVEGKIKVTLYDNKGVILKIKLLSKGDSVLFVSGGHGVNFLNRSRIFEVKQGPYPGIKKAKIFFNNK